MNEVKWARGAGITESEMKAMLQHLASPKAILWDEEDPALVYAFDRSGTQRGKVIVRVNYWEKGYGDFNSFRTEGVVESADLNTPRYKKIRRTP